MKQRKIVHKERRKLHHKIKKFFKGFTLIELLVVIGIIGILVVGMIIAFNPQRQVEKSLNAQRLNDLSTIQTSLDTYYNDHQCYPKTLSFGQQWKEGNTLYLSLIPQDPQANLNGGYQYFTDTGIACPQWNVLFSKLAETKTTNAVCKLASNCAPAGYNNVQWSCTVSGTPNCTILAAQVLPGSGLANTTQTNSKGVLYPTGITSSVTLCHNTGSGYTQITVNPASADVGGHDSHISDIIPPFDYACFFFGTCHYSGKNWTSDNQTVYTNGCNVPDYSVGGYKLDDTKLFQTYAVFTYNPPSFSDSAYWIEASTDPSFPNDNTKTEKYFAPSTIPTFGSLTSSSHLAYAKFSNKYVAFQSLPNHWPFYKCGATLYWRVWNYTYTQSTQTFSNVIDCNTKVGAFDDLNNISSPLDWYNYYPYINTDGSVKSGEPYYATWDPNNDGKIDWTDYIIMAMQTKMRAGGWQPPE